MEIRVDDLSGDQVKALIAEHLLDMTADTPPETADGQGRSAKKYIVCYSISRKRKKEKCP